MCKNGLSDFPKNYDPQTQDAILYEKWESAGLFRAQRRTDRKPFSISMPPPNITGQLHLGHALDNTLPDILVRMKRMQGYEACWMPGTDHASIATEAKIVEAMAKEGISKDDLTREQFLERAWAWKEQYGGQIVKQLRRLGISCDWERERFTMDPGLSRAVQQVFVHLYEKNWIYRGERMVNWCPHCRTSLSDVEVEYEDQASQLVYVRYPLESGAGALVVATSRPETMLGDVAVAVHPEDDRYTHLVGQRVRLPLTDRLIPIVADEYVKPEFGTGVVKITPAHDPNDFAVGQRHDLPVLDTFTDDGHLYDQAGVYAGMDFATARKAIVRDLEALGLVEKCENYTHSVGCCCRCGTTVEPKVSTQWFVRMEPLAKPAIEAVRRGDTQFIPERFSKIYFNWMENIRDWCISRQLWWGHRIPAWYCSDCGEIIVSLETPTQCSHCGSTNLKQDEDTLDTWFSSALWPFAGLGWLENDPDYSYFYPNDLLITGYDIIFFWVARMIFSALEHTGTVPFRDVLLHGIVRDAQGRKMSKSLGNGIDPIEVMDRYGADALRYSLIQGNATGMDQRFQEEKLEAGRGFVNKIWNATRFVLQYFPEHFDPNEVHEADFADEDRWILSRLHQVIGEVTQNLERYEMGVALGKIYSFIWEEFCDWYIEMVKARLHDPHASGRQEALVVLYRVLTDSLKLLHPFMPFVTEALYQYLPGHEPSIMTSAWPVQDRRWLDPDLEEQMASLMDAIRIIRNARLKLNVPFSQKAALIVVPKTETLASAFESGLPFLQKMAAVSTLDIRNTKEGIPSNAVSGVFVGGELFIPLAELVDLQAEQARLKKEEARLQQEVGRLSGKLSNQEFVNKAPAAVVDTERRKLQQAEEMLQDVNERLSVLQKQQEE